MKGKRSFIQVECDQKRCKHFKDCCAIPTEVSIFDKSKPIDILFVGEGAGETEERERRPFCGVSGRLLRRIIFHMFQKKGESVNFAISNIVRCRPTDKGKNRAPNSAEIKSCFRYLKRDIKQLEPKYIVCLGDVAFKQLTEIDLPVSKIHGSFEDVKIGKKTYRVVSTFHPAHCARHPDIISIMVDDLLRPFDILPFHTIPYGKYNLIDTVDKVKDLVDQIIALDKKAHVVIDTEAPNLNRVYDTKLDIIQFCFDGKIGHVIPLHHEESPFSPKELKKVETELRRLFNAKVKFKYWVMHNAKFDITKIYNELGVLLLNRPIFCTMTARFLLNENVLSLATGSGRVGSLGLKTIARQYGFRGFEDEASVIKARAEGTLTKQPLNQILEYCAMDVYVPWHLVNIYLAEAKAQNYRKQLLKLLKYFYSPVYILLCVIESNGIPTDKKRVKKLASKKTSPLLQRISSIEGEFRKYDSVKKCNEILVGQGTGGSNISPIFGTPWVFDINKKAHKQVLFFDVMGLKPADYSKKTGEPSVDKAFISKYSEEYSEVKSYEAHTSAKQLFGLYIKSISTFLDPVKGKADCKDGRIRPQFSMTNTTTGRASAKEPNSQQTVNARNDLAKLVRGIWYSDTECICKKDYMANEVRGWGMVSGDTRLINTFLTGKKYRDKFRAKPTKKNKENAKTFGDIHRMNASEMFSVKPKEVTDEQRQDIKPLTFGPIYGRGVAAMAAAMGKSKEYVSEKLDQFFNKFHIGKKWLDDQVEFARTNYYVESPIGQRRRLYAFMVENEYEQSHAANQAKNSPIQGLMSHCSFIGSFLFLIDYIIPNDLLKTWKLFNVVHDSCESEFPIKDLIEYATASEYYFTTGVTEYIKKHWGYEMAIPLEVEYEFGFRLSEMEKWDFSNEHIENIQANLVKRDKKRRNKRKKRNNGKNYDYKIV